jgi:cell division protein FtsZ
MHTHRFGHTDMIPRICVMGVGDAGATIVNTLAQQGSTASTLVAVCTDLARMASYGAVETLLIGDEITKKQGAGGNPWLGRKAAIATRSRIIDVLRDIDVLIIVAGLGRGTGTGASVEIVKMASRLGMTIVTVLTTPFRFEGKQYAATAQEGLQAIATLTHAQIVVDLEKTMVGDKISTISEAFQRADSVIVQHINGFIDMLSNPGERVLRVNDVRNLSHQGAALVMRIVSAQGIDNLVWSVQAAMADAFVDFDAAKVRQVMIHVRVQANSTLVDVYNAVQHITARIPLGTPMKWGCSDAPRSSDSVCVTILWNYYR